MRMKWFCSFLVFLAWAATSGAQEMVLVIRHAEKTVEIPLAKIDALPQTDYVAFPPGMDDRAHRVKGPLLKDVVALSGFSGDSLLAVGYDRYQADIPFKDMDDYAVIVARDVDGKEVTLREKGPLWIVYPSDAHPELRHNPIYEARSVWQLKEITVR
jgi:hypothetical protein